MRVRWPNKKSHTLGLAALVTVLLASAAVAYTVDAKGLPFGRPAADVSSEPRREDSVAVGSMVVPGPSKVRHSAEPAPVRDTGVVGPARLTAVAEQVLDEAVDLIGDYRLPASIRMQVSRCGTLDSPSYDTNAQQVDLCSEFIEYWYKRALREGDRHALEQARDVSRFAVAHELGHAMIALFRLPVLGKVEDAADQFATMLFLTHNRPAPVLSAAMVFERASRDAQFDRETLGDEHALDGQREANLVCWLFAADSTMFGSIARVLPEQRRANCRAEYAGVVEAWSRLMAPHRRSE